MDPDEKRNNKLNEITSNAELRIRIQSSPWNRIMEGKTDHKKESNSMVFSSIVDPEPDPYVLRPPPGSVIICMDPDLDSDPDSSVNKQKVRKNLIFTPYFVTFFTFYLRRLM